MNRAQNTKSAAIHRTTYGPHNPHPLSQMRTELVWEGKYDEYGNRREVDVAGLAMPLQNQDAKPDDGDGYAYPLFGPNANQFVGPFGRVLNFPGDTYEIFAHAAEARSRALGTQALVAGPFDPNRQVPLNGGAYGFTDSAADHSAQFNSTNMRRHPYWGKLFETFGLNQ